MTAGPLAPGTAQPLIELVRVSKAYPRGETSVLALDDLTFRVGEGEFVAVMGPSGSGKTTLLSILGCLDRPTSGEYRLAGTAAAELSDVEVSRLRNRTIGFVFQAFHLILQLTVLENVEAPLAYSDVPEGGWRPRALSCLERVGLGHRVDHRPAELSGGEAQRAAIARALVMRPRLLLADEPTGNLDSVTGDEIAALLSDLHASGVTVVLVTHNPTLAGRAQRVVRLRDGRLDGEVRG